ncbi:tripartite motif-containing protein 2-like [Anneissia japonica]|uniref:tripartite motif-containing protein 2-like n=1 Tax=Anneissia japonica TaxID=1529436 RepID=UPI001425B41A|nr:tripartite motif-containing protein 2-like [Anneissia japonica]
MNTGTEDVKNALECSICFRRLQEPKSLSCLHTFCLICLQNLMEKQGKLVCPTCRQSQMIPEGGLQKLLPNIYVKNMLECLEKLENAGNTVCCCSQTKAAFFCQQCIIFLCSVCIKQHKILPTLVSHTLHSIEDIKTMTLQQFSSLHPALCPEHKDALKYYCTKCKTAFCIHCTKNKDGSHHYIDISYAFDIFKQKAINTEPTVENFKSKIKLGQKTIKLCLETLAKNKDTCDQEIDGLVKEAIDIVRKHGIALKQDVDVIFQQKKRTIESQDGELTTLLKKVTRTQIFISQLMNSDAATAVESCDKAFATMRKQIENLPEVKQGNNDVFFCKERTQLLALREKGIGVIHINGVPFRMRNRISDEATVKSCDKAVVAILDDNDVGGDDGDEDYDDGDATDNGDEDNDDYDYDSDDHDDNANPFVTVRKKAKVRTNGVASGLEDSYQIASSDPVIVTQGQICKVKIIHNSCVMDSTPLKAILKHSTGAMFDIAVQKINGNSYIVKYYSKIVGIAYVCVYVQEKEIRGSPIRINVVSGRLDITGGCPDMKPYIWHQETRVMDIVIDNYILVAGCSNEVVRFQLCGKYVDRIFLPKGTKVNRMYYIKQSGGLLISDGGKTRIVVHSTSNGNDVLKWNGLLEPYGITMDESKQSKPMYVSDIKAHCIFIYHLNSGGLVRRVGNQGSHSLYQMERPHDVIVTKGGNILVADYGNSRLLLLTSDGTPLKQPLKGKIYHPRAIIADKDGNIIVANKSELKIFDIEEHLIKEISGSGALEGLTMWSYISRSAAVADSENSKIKVFNY